MRCLKLSSVAFAAPSYSESDRTALDISLLTPWRIKHAQCGTR
jgi:hypothetical protein